MGVHKDPAADDWDVSFKGILVELSLSDESSKEAVEQRMEPFRGGILSKSEGEAVIDVINPYGGRPFMSCRFRRAVKRTCTVGAARRSSFRD